MTIDDIKNCFSITKYKYLLVLFSIACIFSGYLILLQSKIGIAYWDIFVYLNNALLFSHINVGSQLSVPPILSILTSFLFQLGYINENAIFIVSGILFVFCIIGTYLLFSEYLDNMLSFFGSILFMSSTIIISWAVSGANDVPSLAFAVWGLYFTIKGTNSNFNFYYLAFICAVLTFFTRFSMGLIFIVMLVYLIFNYKTILNFNKKSIFQLFLFMVIFGFFIMGIYLSYQHTLPFIGQFTEVSVSSQVSSANPGYSVDTMYYFYNLPQYLSSNTINVNYDQLLSTSSNQPTLLSYVFLIMCLIGIGLTIRNSFKKSTHKKNSIILLTLMLITLLTFTKVSYIITMILFTITIILYYFLLDKTLKQIDATMIIWLGISLILHSYHPVKVDRYIITSIIPLIYFIIQSIPLTLNLIEKHIDINKKTKYIKIISIILILLILPITLSYTESLNHTNSRTQIEKESAQWLQEYDPDYKTANISSDRGPIYSWYLKKYVYSIVPRVLKLENDTLENRLETINAKYYIDSTSNINSINGYHKIHEIKSNKTNSTIIYEKN